MKIFTRLFLITTLLTANLVGVANYMALAGGSQQTQGVTIRDQKNLPTLNAYPNPTRGETTITLSQAANEKYTIRISNAIGRVVKTVDFPPSSTAGIQVDMSELPSGFYFYSLLANDKMIETKRLILQR